MFRGLGHNAAAFLAPTPLPAPGAVVAPARMGPMSRRVPDDAQGELPGVVASCRAAATILAPPVLTGVFAAFTAPGAAVHLPGAALRRSMALMVVCGLVHVARPRAESLA